MNQQRLRVSICCPRSAVTQLVCLLLFWLTVPISRFLWPCSISVCCGAPAMSLSSSSHAAHRCQLYVHFFFYSLWHLPWASVLCVLYMLALFIIVNVYLQRLNFFWTQAIPYLYRSFLCLLVLLLQIPCSRGRVLTHTSSSIVAVLNLIRDNLLYVMCSTIFIICFEHHIEFVPSGTIY